MNDFGHGIGAPPHGAPGQPYAQHEPYAKLDPQVQDEGDNLGHAHAQARLLAEEGDLTGARSRIEQALASGELRFGQDDHRLVPLVVDLATIARRLGNLTEARNQLRRAHAVMVAFAGPEHASSLSIEGRLAAVVYRLGEPTEVHDRHLSDAGRRVLGPDHPAVRGAENRLAASAQPAPSLPVPPPVSAPGLPSGNADSEGWAAELPGWNSDSQGWEPAALVTPPAPVTYAPVARGVYQRQPDIEVIPPPPLPVHGARVWPEPPVSTSEATVRWRQSHSGSVAIGASLIVVILVAGVAVALRVFRADSGPADGPVGKSNTITVPANQLPAAATPTTSQPPTRVLIKDEGGSVTLTWDDPSGGQVPFIVSGSRQGNALLALASVPAGQTTSTIHGLNVNENYCFTVSAVWSSDNIQVSIRTCTFRLSTARAS